MYPGWVLIGDSPYDLEGDFRHELINNARAYAYAEQAGICWLQQCLDCPTVELAIPGGPNFVSPKDDPAPWFDADNPDTWGFLGIIGLDVQGVDSSTRHANVTEALTGGGVIGPSYYGPRTIVVRGLAIATDDCSLQAGLDWFRFQCDVTQDPCRGDNFNYFDCCPCMCDDPTGGGPCWAELYFELRLGPTCVIESGFDGLGWLKPLNTATTPDAPSATI
ncbi:MAG TPA: hypothetical protein VIX41_04090, partial [Acidimicrobiales bacterium]